MAKYKLMKHQKKAVKFLRKMDGIGALLFEPGVGKTGSTMGYIDWLAKQQGDVRVLVVAPLTAADTWVLQIPLFMHAPTKARMLQGTTRSLLPKIAAAREWTEVPKMKISVDHEGDMDRIVSGNRVTLLSMSAGAVSSWCTDRAKRVEMMQAIRKYDPHMIVVDESQIIKSPHANISTSMGELGPLAPRRIILTGTVNPHSPLDVFGQWRFLAPWTFSDHHGTKATKKTHLLPEKERATLRAWSWTRFKDRYSISGGFEGRQTVGFVNQKELKNRVAERSMVMLKADALDLPPTTDIDVHVTLSPREMKAYKEMRDELVAELEDGSTLEAPNVLAKLIKLRQITSGFVKNTDTKEIHTIGKSKLNAIKEVVNVQLASEDRIVIFAYFKHEVASIAAALKKKGRVVEVVDGSTKAKDRLAIRQRFGDVSGNPEPTILVAQSKTMSLSVNELVSAQNAIFASFSAQRDDLVQGRGRLDRQGQTKPVTFWNIIVPDLIDEIMLTTHKERGDLEAALLDHIRNLR